MWLFLPVGKFRILESVRKRLAQNFYQAAFRDLIFRPLPQAAFCKNPEDGIILAVTIVVLFRVLPKGKFYFNI
jgi:hypothetical protein